MLMPMPILRRCVPAMAFGLSILSTATTTASASHIGQPGPAPDYGYHWATIGDPGNRDVSAEELDAWGFHGTTFPFQGGGVDYTYRISKYETTVAQWFEFVQVAWPHVQGNAIAEDQLAGGGLVFTSGQWFIFDPMRAASPHWTWAARYCNWLHNGKGTDPSSWESGVYDASTFYEDENGIPQHDLTRAPGAKFFLPTLDEWKKAGHWDPNKNNGEGGYWLYPHGSDEPPVPGAPDEGGETATNYGPAAGNLDYLRIGLYPETVSPWGLFDMSGTTSENTEDTVFTVSLRSATAGSASGSFPNADRMHGYQLGMPHSSPGSLLDGFRIAAVVPSNGPVVAVMLGLTALTRRQRSVHR